MRACLAQYLTFLVKAFPAKFADEGLVARVDADVCVERGAAIEGFAALVTLMWFFLRRGVCVVQ